MANLFCFPISFYFNFSSKDYTPESFNLFIKSFLENEQEEIKRILTPGKLFKMKEELLYYNSNPYIYMFIGAKVNQSKKILHQSDNLHGKLLFLSINDQGLYCGSFSDNGRGHLEKSSLECYLIPIE